MSQLGIFKRPYYYVPPCPRCQSRKTGRYVKNPVVKQDKGYIFEESLKNGEIVEETDIVPVENAFCCDCGYEWSCYIETIWLTPQEILKQKKARGIEGLSEELENERREERKKEPFAKKFFKSLFFGK